jgi:glyoxylase-like metal-dependent hydrolase (beta-lactamase superfamily II)
MTDELRLHLLTSGLCRTKQHLFTLNQGFNEDVEVPLPFFLIEHPEGNVLIDGGAPLAAARDPYYWTPDGEQPIYWPLMSEDDFCVNQVRSLGVDPESIRYVIQTHLHADHIGAIGEFPNARYVVQRGELEYARAPDWFYSLHYRREDFDKDVDWLLLESSDDDLDLYGDGVVRIVFTPGHTPGHSSVVVTLPRDGTVVLAGDACIGRAHFEDRALPGKFVHGGEVVASVRRLRELIERSDGTLVPGHDLEEWNRLRHPPEHYA